MGGQYSRDLQEAGEGSLSGQFVYIAYHTAPLPAETLQGMWVYNTCGVFAWLVGQQLEEVKWEIWGQVCSKEYMVRELRMGPECETVIDSGKFSPNDSLKSIVAKAK